MKSRSFPAVESLEGYVDLVKDGCVHGWAWNPTHPADRLEVRVIVKDAIVASTIADLYRPDLESAGKGDGRHAFELLLPTPVRTAPGTPVRIVAANGADLRGSPVTMPESASSSLAQSSALSSSYRSRFGGLWTDLPDAPAVINGKAALNWITPAEAVLLHHWVSNGFVILKKAVSDDEIDALDIDVERVWSGHGNPRPFVEYWEGEERTLRLAGPEYRERRVKLLDMHGQFDSACRVASAPTVTRFLTLLFERPALAFQSLYFRWGSTQDIHQDSAFVKVSSPMELVAAWIALEDVQPDSGELEYYVGSHQLEDYLFDGHAKWMPLKSEEYGRFVESLHRRAEARGLERRTFRASKGDVLIWSADLAHGGRKNPTPGLTRKSLVVHYCPQNCIPMFAKDGREAARREVNAAISVTSERRG